MLEVAITAHFPRAVALSNNLASMYCRPTRVPQQQDPREVDDKDGPSDELPDDPTKLSSPFKSLNVNASLVSGLMGSLSKLATPDDSVPFGQPSNNSLVIYKPHTSVIPFSQPTPTPRVLQPASRNGRLLLEFVDERDRAQGVSQSHR